MVIRHREQREKLGTGMCSSQPRLCDQPLPTGSPPRNYKATQGWQPSPPPELSLLAFAGPGPSALSILHGGICTQRLPPWPGLCAIHRWLSLRWAGQFAQRCWIVSEQYRVEGSDVRKSPTDSSKRRSEHIESVFESKRVYYSKAPFRLLPHASPHSSHHLGHS